MNDRSDEKQLRTAADAFFTSFSKEELAEMADTAERAVSGLRENPYPPSDLGSFTIDRERRGSQAYRPVYSAPSERSVLKYSDLIVHFDDPEIANAA